MNKLIKIAVCVGLAMPVMAQHSTLTSNYLFNLFAVNPAYAGQKGALDATAFYRKQWVGLTGAPEIYGVMGHMEIKPKNFGVGLQVQNDKIALFTDTRISAAFSYKIKFDRYNALSFGISPGFRRVAADMNKLVTTQSGDATFADYVQTKNSFTSGVGLFFSNRKYYLSITSPDLMQVTTNGKQVEYNLVTGYVFKISDNFSLKPFTLIRGIKNSPLQFDASVTAYFNQVFGIGLSYRNRESLVAFSELLIKKQFKIGYAYDYNIGKLRKFNAGTHEIMVNFFFGKTTNAPSPRFF